MSRTSRVPYHQNVYDLLGIEPGESPEAARMIAEHEAAHGPLPASVREWYLVPNVVALDPRPANWSAESLTNAGEVWWEYSHEDRPTPLAELLEEIAFFSRHSEPPRVEVLSDGQGMCSRCVEFTGADDPPVWVDASWERVADSFSDFIVEWFTETYRLRTTPLSRNGPAAQFQGAEPFLKPYRNCLWLRTPSEPLAFPILDFLTEQFGEPERTPRSGDVTTHTYRPEGGTIRVTADHPAHPEPLSAWWVHADTSERLEEFAQLLLPWGTLRDTLRADTDPAREVWTRLLGERGA